MCSECAENHEAQVFQINSKGVEYYGPPVAPDLNLCGNYLWRGWGAVKYRATHVLCKNWKIIFGEKKCRRFETKASSCVNKCFQKVRGMNCKDGGGGWEWKGFSKSQRMLASFEIMLPRQLPY